MDGEFAFGEGILVFLRNGIGVVGRERKNGREERFGESI